MQLYVSGQLIIKVKFHYEASTYLFFEFNALNMPWKLQKMIETNMYFATSYDSVNTIQAIQNQWTNNSTIQEYQKS